MNYIDIFKNGSGIHIKKANRGKFTDYCGGKVTSECISRGKHSSDPAVRKRATFAANARKWKHQAGGIVNVSDSLPQKSKFYNSVDPKTIIEEPEEKNSIYDESLLSKILLRETTKKGNKETEEDGWGDLITELISSRNQGSKYSVTSEDVKERQKTAMSYLINKGFNKEAAAGIVGVLTAESNLIPGKFNAEEVRDLGDKVAGKGIAQWSNERRKKYDQAMQGKEGLEAELDFFISDLQSRPLALSALQKATTVEEAVKAMHLGYENGSETAFATPEQLEQIYIPKWKSRYNKQYKYVDEHNTRLSHANTAYSLV